MTWTNDIKLTTHKGGRHHLIRSNISVAANFLCEFFTLIKGLLYIGILYECIGGEVNFGVPNLATVLGNGIDYFAEIGF